VLAVLELGADMTFEIAYSFRAFFMTVSCWLETGRISPRRGRMLPGYTIFLGLPLGECNLCTAYISWSCIIIIILTVIQFSMSKIENRSGLNAS